MVDAARTGTGDDVRHAAVVEAVAFAAERLLLATDWREAADEVLERMGLAAGVSRAYVIENHLDEQGRLLGTMRHEWCATGVSSQALNPFLQAAPWHDALGRWAAIHARGEPIVTHIAELPARERPEFEHQDIVSLAEHPITRGDRLDLVTARYLGDPTQFWRVCDANGATRPDELTEVVGRVLRIPLFSTGR